MTPDPSPTARALVEARQIKLVNCYCGTWSGELRVTPCAIHLAIADALTATHAAGFQAGAREMHEEERREMFWLVGILLDRLGGDVTVTFDDLEKVRGRNIVKEPDLDLSRGVRYRLALPLEEPGDGDRS